MRPRERRETGEQDLFRSRLDQIIDMKHPLVALARTVDWRFLEGRFGEVYTDDDHRVFVVRIIRQGLEKTLPNPARSPARKALVGVLPVAEALCFGSAEPCKVG